jgi:hypothetical protein
MLFQCDSITLSPCTLYTVKDLAAPTPRTSDYAAPSNAPPRPSQDDPNWWQNTNKPRPGVGPPSRRAEEKGTIVRTHVMGLDENRKVTVSSSYE